MGLIKFEVEIPNFEKELSINITIRRDGEVFYSTSSPSAGNIDSGYNLSEATVSSPPNVVEDIKESEKVVKKRKKTEEPLNSEPQIETPKKTRGGNFMGMDL